MTVARKVRGGADRRPSRRELIAGGAALLAAGGASARAQQAGDVGFTYGDLREVTVRGKLLPMKATLARMYGAKVPKGKGESYLLLHGDLKFYTFLETAMYAAMVAEGKRAGKAVEVHARQFPGSMILEILKWKEISVAALRWLYFCPVCVIHFRDPGPCVCCGKEVERVKDKAILDEKLGAVGR